jgi:lipopolysaccharide transport system ATP-binding protein
VGVIGRNGAGKSTLLKILSRIVEPTAGWVELRGRIGSLLEVGTGFHPELTGRENIYLAGAILGMKQAEIRKRFDEIVAFAETEKYLDTAVKYYSSGMYMRLAFAVAAHLEPEILIVDEVLAVGDAAFQRKCLNKMREVGFTGRTIIFVSHNMAAINRLCSETMWLEGGKVRRIGPTEAVVQTYCMSGLASSSHRVWPDFERQPGNHCLKLRSVRAMAPNGASADRFDIGRPIRLAIEYTVVRPLANLRLSIQVLNEDGVVVFTSADQNCSAFSEVPRSVGCYVSYCTIPGHFLNSGSYLVSAGADVPFVEVIFFEEMTIGFQVEPGGISDRFAETWPGMVRPALEWSLEQAEATPAA